MPLFNRMDYRFDPVKGRSPLIRFLFHPMLYASLLLHGLVIAIPKTPEPKVEPEDLDDEQEINITSLAPIVRPAAEPEPDETPVPSPQPEPPSPVVPQPAPQPQVLQMQVPQASVSPTTSPETASPPESAVELPPEFDPSQFRDQLASSIQGSSRYFDLGGSLPPLSIFRDSSAYFEETGGSSPTPKVGIIPGRIYLLNGVDLTQERDEGVVDAFRPEDYVPEGLSVIPAGEYGGGPLYDVQNDEGQTVAYLNATSSRASSTTIIVFWDYNPNSLPDDRPDPSDSSNP